jgi:hypothetical protein
MGRIATSILWVAWLLWTASAHAAGPPEFCEEISSTSSTYRPYHYECLAYVTDSPVLCAKAGDHEDACRIYEKFLQKKSGGAACNRSGLESTKDWCEALAKRWDGDCRSLSVRTEQLACLKMVAALEKLDAFYAAPRRNDPEPRRSDPEPTSGRDASSSVDRASSDESSRITVRRDTPASTALTEEAAKIRDRESRNDLGASKVNAEIIFSNGLMYLKTTSEDGRYDDVAPVDGKVIFVMAMNGKVYVRPEPHGVPRADGFTHANFLSGAPVRTAGQMFVRGGRITRVDNESGHYKPTGQTAEWALRGLIQAGADLRSATVVMLGESGYKTYRAMDYLEQDAPTAQSDRDRQDDEEFQTVYDAHIGKDTVRFSYFGWPWGRLRPHEWKARITLIETRLAAGIPVKVELEFKEGDNDKGAPAARDLLDRLTREVGGEAGEKKIVPALRGGKPAVTLELVPRA